MKTKDNKNNIDCIAMKESIQGRMFNEMRGMKTAQRIAYIHQRARQAKTGGVVRRIENHQAGLRTKAA